MIGRRAPTSQVALIEPSDFREFVDVLSEGFGLNPDMAFQLFQQDPQRDAYIRLGLWKPTSKGRDLASILTVLPCRMELGGMRIDLAGISGVTTHTEHRRKGYSRTLMDATLVRMAEAGYVAAGLIPFDYAFYRKHGFEMCAVAYEARVKPETLPKYPEAACVQVWESKHLMGLKAVHAAVGARRAGAVERRGERWNYIIWNNRRRMVAERGQGIEGYLLYDLVEHGQRLRAREFLYTSEFARRALVGWLAKNPERAREVSMADSLDAASRTFPQLADFRHAAPDQAMSAYQAMPNLMLRTLNARAALEQAVAVRGAPSQTVTIEIKDPLLNQNAGPWALSDKIERVEGRAQIRMEIGAFSAMLGGGLTPVEAMATGAIRGDTGAIEAIDRLFPRLPTCLTLADYF